MLQNTTENQTILTTFLSFVDSYTYIMDGQRYHNVDQELITMEELAFIFLDSDYNK